MIGHINRNTRSLDYELDGGGFQRLGFRVEGLGLIGILDFGFRALQSGKWNRITHGK